MYMYLIFASNSQEVITSSVYSINMRLKDSWGKKGGDQRESDSGMYVDAIKKKPY